MVTFLSGGTGTPKLLDGFISDQGCHESDFSVVANVGDDILLSGNLVCPDIDSVLYTLSGRIDTSTWYGIDGDTFITNDFIHELSEFEGPFNQLKLDNPSLQIGENRAFSGRDEFMKIGDKDRALHINRTALLKEGKSLTEATGLISERLGIEATVLPATDDPLATWIIAENGEKMHFQEFWVQRDGDVSVKSVEFLGEKNATVTTEVRSALREPVILGPSNPVTSIGPMLTIKGFEDLLEQTYVLGIAPFIGNKVFSGPAGDLLQSEGYAPSTMGWLNYLGFMNEVLLDESDPTQPDRPDYRDDLTMDEPADRRQLAARCMEIIQDYE